jgi:hypothetical protein
VVRDPNMSCYRHWVTAPERNYVTAHIINASDWTSQKMQMKRRKKKERYQDSVAMDSLDQCALEPVARTLSSRTYSHTSKLGDSLDQCALEPVA